MNHCSAQAGDNMKISHQLGTIPSDITVYSQVYLAYVANLSEGRSSLRNKNDIYNSIGSLALHIHLSASQWGKVAQVKIIDQVTVKAQFIIIAAIPVTHESRVQLKL